MATRKAAKKPAPAKGGRPSKYRAEFAEQARKLCLLGATDQELADFFGVDKDTINRWKGSHPGFYDSITRGKTLADADVAERLYMRAMGYEHDAVKIFNDGGVALTVPYIERYPPDTQAASLWLRNRQPRKWRDKQQFEHTGPDGGPIQTTQIPSSLGELAAALGQGNAPPDS